MTDLPDPKSKYGIQKASLSLIPLAALEAAAGAHQMMIYLTQNAGLVRVSMCVKPG